jgi:hypothetical protein
LRAFLLLLLIPLDALALSPAAQEFMQITRELEPLQCQKRQLRRQIVMADTEGRPADARKLREDFSKLDRDPKTSKLERRLAELEKHITEDDLPAINRQHVEAFYRCD